MTRPLRIPPRLLDRSALRAYLGDIADADLSQRLARHQIPQPLWGQKPNDRTARWDRIAVDRALDRASDIPRTVEASTEVADAAFFGRA